MRWFGFVSLVCLGCRSSSAGLASASASATASGPAPSASSASAPAAPPPALAAASLPAALRALPAELGPGTLAPEVLLAVGGDGFVTAWGKTALDGKQRKSLAEGKVEAGTLAGLPGKLGAFPSGWVQAARERDEGGPERAFVVVLVVEQLQTLRLSVGAVGHLRLFAAGREVLSHESTADRAPLTDERFVDVELRAGATTLVALTRATSPRGATFSVRLRTPDEGTPRAWVAPLVRARGGDPVSATPLGALLDVSETHDPIAGGQRLALSLALRGLGPDVAAPARLLLEGVGRAEASLTREALFRGAPLTADLDLRPKKDAKSGKEPMDASPHRPSCRAASLRVDGERDGVGWSRTYCWRGALHEEAVALARTLTSEGRAALEPARLSLVWDLSEILSALADERLDVQWAQARVDQASTLAADLARGEDPFARATGVVRRAFRSPLDGALSGYLLYVPPSSRRAPKKGGAASQAPLVVIAHGLDHRPEHALRGLIGEAPDRDMDLGFAARHLPPFPDLRAFLVAPTAYGNAGPRPLGEADTLAVVDDVARHYAIDPLRVSMTGYSLGGTLAFTLPLHHPDRFSSAAPLCGYPNLLTYESVAKVPHKTWEDALLGARYIGHYAENGLHVPLYPVHGGKDGPGRTQVMVDRYRALGYRVDFDLQEDLDHDVWTHAYEDGRMIVRLRGQARPERASHVRLVTGDYRWDRSHWVRIHALAPELFSPFEGTPADWKAQRFADVDARYEPDSGKLVVTAKNVAELDLDVPALKRGSPLELHVNGKGLGPIPADKRAFVALDGPRLLPSLSSQAGKKRHGVAGPLDDLGFHPLVFVYGTRSPAHEDANRLLGEYLARKDAYAARYPLLSDADVRWADLRGRSVILIGGPESNLLAASLAPLLPVRFGAGSLELRGERFEGASTGVAFLTQSPLDPDRYVALYAGLTPRATLLARFLPRLSPDFVVWDERLAGDRGELLLGKREVLRAGNWDDRWR